MILRAAFTLTLSLGLAAPLASAARAQAAADGVVEVPLSVPSQRSGIVPTTLLPMGALRMESGGVRLPGQPAPQIPESRPAPVASAPNPAAPSKQARTGCVGALNAPLQVQLGAVDGRAAADREADRLMRRHGDLLLTRPTPTDCAASRKDMFRLRLAVPTPAEGQRICNDMAKRGERCIVVRGGT